MSVEYTTQQVEQIFEQLDLGNTKEATEAIKNAKQPQFGISCYDLLMGTSKTSLKVHCAIQLRQSIEKVWIVLPSEYKQQMLTTILDRVISEQEIPARTAIANLVATIGKIAYNEWGSHLLNFLNNCVNNGDSISREVAAIVFKALFTSLGSQIGGHFDSFAVVMHALLKDTTPRVQKYTFDALSALSEMIETKAHGKTFAPLIHPLLNACDQLLNSYHPDMSDNLIRAFQLFSNLIDKPYCLGTPEIVAITKVSVTAISMAANGKIEQDDKIIPIAAEVVTIIGEERPRILTKEKLINPLITALLGLASLPVENEEDLDFADEDLYSLAVYSMDRIAANGSPRSIFSELVSICGPHLMSSDCWKLRGALGLVSVVAEGCAEPMKRHAASLCEASLTALKHAKHLVRMTAIFALQSFAEHLSPEFLRFHSRLVPVLTSHCIELENASHSGTIPSDSSLHSQVTMELHFALATLSAVIVGMSPSEIAGNGYIDISRPQNLLSVISSFLKRPNQSLAVMSKAFTIFNAIAKAASYNLPANMAAEIVGLALPLTQRTPEELVNMLPNALKSKDSDDAVEDARSLIGHAIMCVGAVICASPSVVLNQTDNTPLPLLQEVITLVMKCAEEYKTDSAMISCILSFIEDVVVGLKYSIPDGAILPFMNLLLSSASIDNLSRGFFTAGGTKFEDLVGAPADEDDDNNYDLEFDQTVSSEVNTALKTLRRIYWVIPNKVAPLTGDVLVKLSDLTAAAVQSVADNACETLSAVVHGFHKSLGLTPYMNNDGRVTPAGIESSTSKQVTPLFMELYKAAFVCIWNVVSTHNSMEVVASAVLCIACLIKLVGPVGVEAIEIAQTETYAMIIKFLQKKHQCQLVAEEDDVDDSEENTNDESFLFENVAALCGAMAACDNARFMQFFRNGLAVNGKNTPSLIDRLVKLVGPKASLSQRDLGVSFFCEIMPHLTGEHAPGYVRQVVEICMTGCQQRENSTLLSNSIFTIGCTAEVGGGLLFTPEVAQKVCLEYLLPVASMGLKQNGTEAEDNVDDVNITQDELHSRDNAVGALCRFFRHLPITHFNTAAGGNIIFDTIIPAILAALPLREDCRESITVLRGIQHLMLSHSDKIFVSPQRERSIARLCLKEFFQPESLMEEEEVKQIVPFICQVGQMALNKGLLTKKEIEEITDSAQVCLIDNEAYSPELFKHFRAVLGLSQ